MILLRSGFVILLVTLSGTEGFGQVDRNSVPQPGPPPPLTLPAIQRAALGNDLSIILVEHHELPIVQMRMVIQSGAADDPEGKSGLADLTAQMLQEGTKKRDALQIADDLDFIGANMSVQAGVDASTASLLTLKEHLDAALEIFSDVLLQPTFPPNEWDRVQKSHLTALLQQQDRPSTVAGIVFDKTTFGDHHPYGRPSEGTKESVGAIGLDDMKDFYAAHFRPNNATLIVVGDVVLTEIRKLAEEYLGSWKSGGKPPADVWPDSPARETRIYLVDKPEAAQSEIRIGHVGVSRSTADYFAVVVMNTILGGQFSSRVNLNLREEKGYTYGARTGFSMRKEPGSFVASAAVQTAATDSSVIEFMKELRRIRDEDVRDDELESARQSLVLREPRNFETPAQIAGQLETLVIYGLPDDYFETYVQGFEAVTAGDVRRVAEKYIRPDSMNIVVVGDVMAVKEGLENLGYGGLIMMDPDGNQNN